MITGGLTIQRLLAGMRRHSASDLHIKVGVAPTYRINGVLRAIGSDVLSAEEADHLLDPIVPEASRPRYDQTGDLDFATYNEEGDRFRINMFRAGGHVSAAIRRVKAEIPTYSALHLPPIYGQLVERTNDGLILVVGVTGSGKSTTLAAMIENINETRFENIITLEDPVEYRFVSRKSIVSQREMGIDTPDYKSALRYMVRQDPDVIFIGEMRDHDTVLAAVQAAETGHLVFGSLHTADTMQAFNRILEFFTREEHAFIRSALANTLKAICAQRLLPAVENFAKEHGGMGTLPATEVLINTPIVGEKIREGEDADLPSIINASTAEGMHSMTQSLADLVKKDWVDLRTAMSYAPSRDALDSEIKGLDVRSKTLVSRIKAGPRS